MYFNKMNHRSEYEQTRITVWHSFLMKIFKVACFNTFYLNLAPLLTNFYETMFKNHGTLHIVLADLAVGQIQYSDHFTYLWLFTSKVFQHREKIEVKIFKTVKTCKKSTVQCHERGHLKWEEQQLQQTPTGEERIHIYRSLTFVHQSSLSCCSSQAPPLSCPCCSDGKQRHTIYQLLKPQLPQLLLLLPPGPGRNGQPL